MPPVNCQYWVIDRSHFKSWSLFAFYTWRLQPPLRQVIWQEGTIWNSANRSFRCKTIDRSHFKNWSSFCILHLTTTAISKASHLTRRHHFNCNSANWRFRCKSINTVRCAKVQHRSFQSFSLKYQVQLLQIERQWRYCDFVFNRKYDMYTFLEWDCLKTIYFPRIGFLSCNRTVYNWTVYNRTMRQTNHN